MLARIFFTNKNLIVTTSIILFSLQVLAQTVTVLDTIYTLENFQGGPLEATIFIPVSSNGTGVVLTHGYTGSRDKLYTWCDTLAANGFVAMTIDYHDFSDTIYGKYPKPVQEFKMAVEFLRKKAIRFGILTNKVAGIGFSEGAYHWGQSITWDNDDEFFQTDSTVNDQLDAVVLFYGLYDNNNYLNSIIPVDSLLTAFFAPDPSLRNTKGNCIANVSNISTPILMFHGTIDQVIQFEQSSQFQDSLLLKNKASTLITDTSWNHAFDLNYSTPPYNFTAAGLIAKDSVLAFLKSTLLSDTFQLSVNIADGWNMVSIPGLHPANQNVETWWTGKISGSGVYQFIPGTGYELVTVAAPTKGYWMKNNEEQTYNTGDEWPAGGIQFVLHSPINADAGWNMIGVYEDTIYVSELTTNPPEIITGQVYKFMNGYQPTDVLLPGYCYWIKLSEAGQIIIESNSSGTTDMKPVKY